MTDKQAIVDVLVSDGWKEYPVHGKTLRIRQFCKRFDTPTRCAGNDEKQGMQICINVSTWPTSKVCYELDITGCLPDGTWIKVHNWAMPDDIQEGLRKIPRLLAAWEFLAALK